MLAVGIAKFMPESADIHLILSGIVDGSADHRDRATVVPSLPREWDINWAVISELESVQLPELSSPWVIFHNIGPQLGGQGRAEHATEVHGKAKRPFKAKEIVRQDPLVRTRDKSRQSRPLEAESLRGHFTELPQVGEYTKHKSVICAGSMGKPYVRESPKSSPLNIFRMRFVP